MQSAARPIHSPFLHIPSSARIIIIEGIAGSGKSTFLRSLKEGLAGRDAHFFSEEGTLLSWEHNWVDGIDGLRIGLFERLLALFARELARDPQEYFVLERFHLSAKCVSEGWEEDLERRYLSLVHALAALPVHVVLLRLDERDIPARIAHAERGRAWRAHQERKRALRGASSLEEMYAREQERMLQLLLHQQLPYSIIPAQSRELQ